MVKCLYDYQPCLLDLHSYWSTIALTTSWTWYSGYNIKNITLIIICAGLFHLCLVFVYAKNGWGVFGHGEWKGEYEGNWKLRQKEFNEKHQNESEFKHEYLLF